MTGGEETTKCFKKDEPKSLTLKKLEICCYVLSCLWQFSQKNDFIAAF